MADAEGKAAKVREEVGDPSAQAKPAKSQQGHIHPGHLYHGLIGVDRLVVSAGVIAAALHGAAAPLFSVGLSKTLAVTISASPEEVARTVRAVCFLMLCIVILTFAGAFLWTTAMLWVSARQTTRLRTKYFESVLTRDMSWFDLNQPATLPARMATETKKIHDAIGMKAGEIVMNFSQFVVGLTAAFVFGWRLALVISGLVPVILGIGAITTMKVKAAAVEQNHSVARAGAVIEESVLAIRAVSAFGGEGQEVERLEKELVRAKRTGIHTELHFGLSSGLFAFMICCGQAMSFWYSSQFMLANESSEPADVIIVVLAMVFGVSGLKNIEEPLEFLVQALAAATSMYSVLDVQPVIEPLEEGGQVLPEALGTLETIEFRGVHFGYPSEPAVPVLQGLDLRISRGQKVALVGGSGSGKSTVVKLLERFYDPLRGQIYVNDVPLPQLPVHAWRRLLGYVGQEPVLFQSSVLENIRCGRPEITDEQCVEAARHAEAFDFVRRLPLEFQTSVGVGGGQLSGGQKQRLAIARALARQPQILILDEATSALDNASEQLVQATLDQLQDKACSGLTTLSVAHRLSTIINSDVLFVLQNGRVVEQGSHAELMAAQGEYFYLVQAQSVLEEERDEGEAQGDGSPGPEDTRSSWCHQPPGSSFSRAFQTGLEHELEPSPLAVRTNSSRSILPIFESLATAASSAQGIVPMCNVPEARAAPRRTLRRLVGLTRPEWAIYPVAFIGTLLSGALLPILGLLLSRSFSSLGLEPVEAMLASINYYGLCLVIIGGGTGFFGEAAKHCFFGYIQECLNLRLRKAAFASMMCQEIGFFDDPNNNLAGMSTSLARMVADVALMTGIGLGNLFQSVTALCVGLAFSFYASPKLTLVILASMPLVGISMTVTAKVLTDPYDNDAKALAESTAATAVLNIRTVRAFSAEAHFHRIFAEALAKATVLEARSAKKKGLAVAANSVMIFSVYLLGLWYSGHLVTQKEVTGSDVWQALMCITVALMGSGFAATYWPLVQHGLMSAGTLFDLIDRESKINGVSPSGSHRDLGSGTIQIQDVSFRFPHRAKVRVLRHVNFSVAKGQTVALVGPSGSGKSTIIQLLLRFYDPTRGGITVGGTSLSSFDLKWWRGRLGLVSQEPVLFDISLEENVRYGFPEATRAQVEEAARVAKMEYAFDGTVAWEDSLGLRGERLSGGQKQRCAIARAVVRCPDVLLLDEATSALDSASEQAVQAALDSARRGRTTITIAHRLHTIRDSDMILVLDEGKIVERGTHEQLLAVKGWYASMIALS